ncbi:FUSC family protein [Clostridium sardiniense]|uniref:FUSC family protein n=1 Tax=Clostridium sardiniense TaxID=29369 RepID=UPI00195C0B03|nr:FUSC family protein [Clostridium sardiniense]MBM7835807.1 hypothetical protein [Clostridium sardiniense]
MTTNQLKTSAFKAIFTVIILIAYKTLFGNYNASIGLMIALSCISFLKFDFTLYPLYKVIELTGLSSFLLVMSFLSGFNPLVGLIINMFTIFIVSYIYTNTSKNMVSYLFVFIYIYMIGIPVPLNLLPERFLSLLFGIFIIIISQFLFNKNKFKNSCTTMILDALHCMNEEIKNILENNYDKKDNLLIHNSLRNLLLLINDKNLNGIFSNALNKPYFNIAIILERLNTLINKINMLEDVSFRKEYLKYLNYIICNIIGSIENKNFNYKYVDFSYKCSDSHKESKVIEECTNLIELLCLNVNTLNHPINTIKLDLKELFCNNHHIHINSLKFNFSFKISVAISLSMFFIDKFNLINGKWMLITIYVLMQPFISETIVKTKKRIKGTIIGICLFVLIFGVLHTNIPSSLFLFFIFFVYFYATDYYVKVIFTCMLALSMNLTGDSLETLSTLRFSFIILGSLISLLFSKYFLPFTHSIHVNHLKDKYLELSSNMLSEFCDLLDGKGNEENLIKLALDCNTIESSLLSISKTLNDPSIEEFINNEYIVISHIRLSTLNFYHNKFKRSLI